MSSSINASACYVPRCNQPFLMSAFTRISSSRCEGHSVRVRFLRADLYFGNFLFLRTTGGRTTSYYLYGTSSAFSLPYLRSKRKNDRVRARVRSASKHHILTAHVHAWKPRLTLCDRCKRSAPRPKGAPDVPDTPTRLVRRETWY